MKCLHCEGGMVLHDDGMHRSLGWVVPCQREMTEEEATIMWRALLDDPLYVLPQTSAAGQASS